MNLRLVLVGFLALSLGACRGSARVPVEARAGVVVGEVEGPGPADRVWVCHRGRWQEVAAAAAGAHDRHGDRVSRSARAARSAC